MIRRVGDAPEAGRRYRLRRGAYAVALRDGKVMLTHQDDPTPEFQLPGGGIDAGESPVRALHREALEETGWRFQVVRRLGAFRRFTFMPEYDLWAEKLCLVYLARPTLRIGSPSEPGHTAHWLAPDAALRCLANPGDRRFLRVALEI